MQKLLLRPVEVSEVTGLGRTTIYALLASGELPSIRVGGSIRVPVDRLRDWIDRKAGDVASGQEIGAA